jgi:parallel beta-helix repeat protein
MMETRRSSFTAGQTQRRAWRILVGALSALLASLVAGSAPAQAGPTYHVDATTGDDSRTDEEAQHAATPWRTIQRAIDGGGLVGITKKGDPLAGYTVIVKPGVYGPVESKRDGLPGSPVLLKAETPGAAVIQAGGLIGIYIQHHHHVVDGFVVTGGTIGIKMGPHRRDEWAVGLVARRNEVHGNTSNGLQFRFGLDALARDNIAHGNGESGIKYSGVGGQIHDNVAHQNADFGIYVRDGHDHQVWNNTAHDNGLASIKIAGSILPPPGGRTFHVSPTAGDDARGDLQAQSPATPWQTTRRALQNAHPGDTVVLLPGFYTTSIESIRDGTVEAPITIKALTPGTATITPATGSGLFIGHHHHIVEGLAVTGATTGLQMGPGKKTDEALLGLVVRDCLVHGNGIAVKFSNTVDGVIMHSVIRDNSRDGIWYTGRSATIVNNLLHGNGGSGAGEYAITLATGDGHLVMNNTIHANVHGGIRLAASNAQPVFSTVVNNIVTANPIGIKEPGGADYAGGATLTHNNVWGSGSANYELNKKSGGSAPGPGSVSLDPRFIDAASGDFRLGRRDSGQAADSPMIDRGSDTAEALGLDGRTAFADRHPDAGIVDLGYHPTVLVPALGSVTVHGVRVTLDPGGTGLFLDVTLTPGPGSDGLEPGIEYVEVSLSGFEFFVPAASFQPAGPRWTSAGGQGITTAILEAVAGGSVRVTVEAGPLAEVDPHGALSVRIGDDFAWTTVPLRGVLTYP